MINVFATSKHIHIRYDLKGSRVGRRVLTGKRDAEIMAKGDLALKDLDLEKRKEKMYIGEKSELLQTQVKNDADFLCKIGANDYSLLLGIHYINKEKKKPNIRVSMSNIHVNFDESLLKESSFSNKSSDLRQEKLKALVDFEDGGIISETGNEIYFVGIIDILTKFNFKKKCEYFIKMLKYCSNNMSCTTHDMYRDRFVNYMNKVIQKSSSFNSVKNPLMERFKNINNDISTNTNNTTTYNTSSSNNILILNNTNNFYNIINNNNNITLKPKEEENSKKKNSLLGFKKERLSINLQINPHEIIKEESEVEKASVTSSKKIGMDKGLNDGNNSSLSENKE